MSSRDDRVTINQAVRALISAPMPDAYQQAQDDLRQVLPRKLNYHDRQRGLKAMGRYAQKYTPELARDEDMTVLEVGPGVGYWMEIARALGHSPFGVDATPYAANVESYRDMTEALDLPVQYIGFDALDAEPLAGAVDMIHARGSLDALVGRFSEDEQRSRVLAFAARCEAMLLFGKVGLLHVTHNRDERMALIQDTLMTAPGFRSERIDEQTTRHWLA